MYRKENVLNINTNEQWERLSQFNGLIVVDIYTECFGPCYAMLNNLKKLTQHRAHKLILARAKSDNIKALEKFKDKSEPVWMFLIEGKIVNIMYGANAPKLIRMIQSELKSEISVKEGTRVRSELDLNNLPEREEIEVKEPIVEKIQDTKTVVAIDNEFLYCPFGTM